MCCVTTTKLVNSNLPSIPLDQIFVCGGQDSGPRTAAGLLSLSLSWWSRSTILLYLPQAFEHTHTHNLVVMVRLSSLSLSPLFISLSCLCLCSGATCHHLENRIKGTLCWVGFHCNKLFALSQWYSGSHLCHHLVTTRARTFWFLD